MVGRIRLTWANKFRELVLTDSYADIIIKFSKYIEEEEQEFNEHMAEKYGDKE